jgi:hypothetical protein
MRKLKISSLSLADIEQIVTLQESSGSSFGWEDVSAIALTEAEEWSVKFRVIDRFWRSNAQGNIMSGSKPPSF